MKGKVLAKMAKSAVKDFSKQIDDWSKQIEGGLEGFLRS